MAIVSAAGWPFSWAAAAGPGLQVNLAAVTPSDRRLLARISSLSPWTISWSNVGDYLLPADFHRMARAASCPGGADTVHTMHAMNWVYETKGTCYLDLLVEELPTRARRTAGCCALCGRVAECVYACMWGRVAG